MASPFIRIITYKTFTNPWHALCWSNICMIAKNIQATICNICALKYWQTYLQCALNKGKVWQIKFTPIITLLLYSLLCNCIERSPLAEISSWHEFAIHRSVQCHTSMNSWIHIISRFSPNDHMETSCSILHAYTYEYSRYKLIVYHPKTRHFADC